MAFNPLVAQPPSADASYAAVFAALGACYRALLPDAGRLLAGNIWDLPPEALAPNWDAGAVLFSYPTVGEWISIAGLGSPATWTEFPTHLSDSQWHTLSISTAVLTDPPGVDPLIAAAHAAAWVDPLVGALTANTSLDGAVSTILPVRYIIGAVEFAKKEYGGLVLQSLVQLRRWYPRG